MPSTDLDGSPILVITEEEVLTLNELLIWADEQDSLLKEEVIIHKKFKKFIEECKNETKKSQE